jgi:hypothetical protein
MRILGLTGQLGGHATPGQEAGRIGASNRPAAWPTNRPASNTEAASQAFAA